MSAPPPDLLAEGARFLERGDLAAAERAAGALLAGQENPDALHLLGLVRMQQNRMEDGVALLSRSLAARPRHPFVLLNLAKMLVPLGREDEALAALKQALTVMPMLGEAWYELGAMQLRSGDLAASEETLRKVLAMMPGHLPARLSLGIALRHAGRLGQSETLLSEGMAIADRPQMKAAFAYNLASAQYEQGKKELALENYDAAARLDPQQGNYDITRAEVLEEMLRFEPAAALLADLVRREPMNGLAHAAYNDLLHRLGRDAEFLKSYERLPPDAPVQIGKAGFLLKTGRAEEAHLVYAAIAARQPANLDAAIGAAAALNNLGRHDEAMRQLESAQSRNPANAALLGELAATALQCRDPQKAAAMAEKSLALSPLGQRDLAVLGSAWRMMGDERDELLNGYDNLIGVFDLEPPQGFSSIADFHAELNAWLEEMHPKTREPLHQTLRSGSQTRGHIFGVGHVLAEQLKTRIDQAIARYVAEFRPDEQHPFRGRRGAGVRFNASWSSRLRDCGFHTNHIHPGGWISSCYYVGVPDAVKDEKAQAGWIKFGEPGFDIGLGARRAIQPAPGRLVLFPSYMWHGTIPFRSDSARTTIAFDAVPV